MKRMLLLLLCLSLLLAGCGGSDGAKTGVDVDLTAMSSTVVFGEVSSMVYEPENYIGKTVRMAGTFNVVESGEIRYFSCLIADATACCKQGLEFELREPRTYPEEYPRFGAEITVVGTFETYEEDGMTYCRVADAVFE